MDFDGALNIKNVDKLHVVGKDHGSPKMFMYKYSTLNINIYNCIIANKMFFIIYAMDLCKVFHSVKLLLSILVGAQKFHS
jgi:hypothetical protein